MHHFPGKQERKPGHADESGGAGAKHRVARRRVTAVAVCGEVAIAPGEEDESEGAETEGCHPEAVDEGVEDDFGGEDAIFLSLSLVLSFEGT